MHFHWQNLNDGQIPRRGGGARHGRAWWHFEKVTVGVDWAFFWRGACHLTFNAHRGDGVGLQWSIAVPWLFSLYLTIDGGLFSRIAQWLLPRKARDPWTGRVSICYADREVQLSIHDWSVWWALWTDPMSWSSRTPKWRHGCWHFLDTLLGKARISERVVRAPQAVIVPMPERGYKAEIALVEMTHKRPRWFARRWMRADIDCKLDPIGQPGKGESAYDCGEDATYSMSCPASSVEEGIAHLVESILRRRGRYGGSVNWRPTEDHRPSA